MNTSLPTGLKRPASTQDTLTENPKKNPKPNIVKPNASNQGNSPVIGTENGPGTTTALGNNPATRTRPIRANAGTGGRITQQKRAFDAIRPDLNARKATRGLHQGQFSDSAQENDFAPRQPVHGGKKPATAKSKEKAKGKTKEQLNRRPTTSDPPLNQTVLPSTQMRISDVLRQSSAVNQAVNQALSSQNLNQTGVQTRNLNPQSQSNIQNLNALNFNTQSSVHNFNPQLGTQNFNPQSSVQSAENPQNVGQSGVGGIQNIPYNIPSSDLSQQRQTESFLDMLLMDDQEQEDAMQSHALNQDIDYNDYDYDNRCDNPDNNADSLNINQDHGNHSGFEDEKKDSEHESDESSGDDKEPSNDIEPQTGMARFDDIDEMSPDEDDRHAVSNLRDQERRQQDENRSGYNSAEDVNQAYRKKNRAQKPPNPSKLKQAEQQQSQQRLFLTPFSEQSDIEDEEQENESDHPVKQRALRNSKPPNPKRREEHIGHYEAEWQSVLVEAQSLWFRHLILERDDPFPVRSDHLKEAQVILHGVIASRLNQGRILDNTYEQTPKMNLCVFNAHSQWRKNLRDQVVPIVNSTYHKLLTDPYPNDEEVSEFDFVQNQAHERQMILDNITSTLDESTYHHGKRVDAQGRINNFEHPSIPQAVITMFYSGRNCLAKLFPEDFEESVPIKAVALAVAMIRHTLYEWSITEGLKRFVFPFEGKVQKEHFEDILDALYEVEKHPYHGAKLSKNFKNWASLGMENLNGKRQTKRIRKTRAALE